MRRTHLIAILLSTAVAAQGQRAAMDPPDIYSSFVGKWVGSSLTLRNGRQVVEPVSIEITETSKKDAIREDTAYGKPGEKGFSKDTRFMILDPAKSQLTLYWKGNPKDIYDVVGLDQFAQTGYGSLVGIQQSLDGTQPVTYRLTIQVTKDSFTYKWEQSANGQPFLIRSLFSFVRETSKLTHDSGN
jgi:hypothetical protein